MKLKTVEILSAHGGNPNQIYDGDGGSNDWCLNRSAQWLAALHLIITTIYWPDDLRGDIKPPSQPCFLMIELLLNHGADPHTFGKVNGMIYTVSITIAGAMVESQADAAQLQNVESKGELVTIP